MSNNSVVLTHIVSFLVNVYIVQAHPFKYRCIYSPAAMVERDLPGYAIGGLSGGEEKDIFWRIVTLCTGLLPRDKPRYVMGVG